MVVRFGRFLPPVLAARERFPTLTLAFESIELRQTVGVLSATALAAATCSKMASVSGSFFSGWVLSVYEDDSPGDSTLHQSFDDTAGPHRGSPSQRLAYRGRLGH